MTSEQIGLVLASSGAVGTLIVPLITFLKTFFKLNGMVQGWRRVFKMFLSLVTSLLAGVLVVAVSGLFVVTTLASVLIAGGVIFTSASIVYNLYWRDSEPERVVEDATKKLI